MAQGTIRIDCAPGPTCTFGTQGYYACHGKATTISYKNWKSRTSHSGSRVPRSGGSGGKPWRGDLWQGRDPLMAPLWFRLVSPFWHTFYRSYKLWRIWGVKTPAITTDK